jgi:hypothetical protein
LRAAGLEFYPEIISGLALLVIFRHQHEWTKTLPRRNRTSMERSVVARNNKRTDQLDTQLLDPAPPLAGRPE